MAVVSWIRRSLREFDNTALVRASKKSEEVVPFYCVDERYFKETDLGYPRVRFWREALKSFKDRVDSQEGKKLVVRKGDPVEELKKIVEQTSAEKVLVNQDYTPYFRKVLEQAREEIDAEFEVLKDVTMFDKEEILTNSGTPYKVYSYYMKKWFEKEKRKPVETFAYKVPDLETDEIPEMEELGFERPEELEWEWEGSRESGLERLESFKDEIGFYKERRDIPAKDGTSRLSPHLKFGTVSIREVFWEMEELKEEVPSAREGIRKWQEELAWRDFYFQMLWNFPETVEKAFIKDFRELEWSRDNEKFKRWKEGKTGFPFVDAGMRQLRRTGWMHNRARMVVTSFASKDLWLDWQMVHTYFKKAYVDAELSSMIGGIQWAYSIGTDPQPYFRVFNPWTQGEDHDPEGEYIKEFVPELREVPGKYIHRPQEMPEDVQEESNCIIGEDYPEPIVDHSERRENALNNFKKAKGD